MGLKLFEWITRTERDRGIMCVEVVPGREGFFSPPARFNKLARRFGRTCEKSDRSTVREWYRIERNCRNSRSPSRSENKTMHRERVPKWRRGRCADNRLARQEADAVIVRASFILLSRHNNSISPSVPINHWRAAWSLSAVSNLFSPLSPPEVTARRRAVIQHW